MPVCHLDDKVARVADGTKPRKGGDDLAKRNAVYAGASAREDLVDAFLGRFGIGFVLHIHRGRTEQKIAVHRGGNEDALAHLGGHAEDCMRYGFARRAVEQKILALARGHRKSATACHVGNRVAVYACGVDDVGCFHGFARGRNSVYAVRIGDGGYCKVGFQHGTVVHRVSDGGNREHVGADDTARGRVQRADDVLRQIGLDGTRRVARKNLQIAHAILLSAKIQGFDGLHIPVGKADDKRAVVLVMHAELLCHLRHLLRAAHVENRLQRPLLGVKACMHDAAVRLGGAHGNITLLFQNANRDTVARQFSGNHAADNSRADDSNVKHCLSSENKKSCKREVNRFSRLLYHCNSISLHT